MNAVSRLENKINVLIKVQNTIINVQGGIKEKNSTAFLKIYRQNTPRIYV